MKMLRLKYFLAKLLVFVGLLGIFLAWAACLVLVIVWLLHNVAVSM